MATDHFSVVNEKHTILHLFFTKTAFGHLTKIA